MVCAGGAAALAGVIGMALADRPVQAQGRYQFIGSGRCTSCHTHAAEKTWATTRELAEVARLWPAAGKTAGHINSDSQLADPKAAGYAKAIGLADPYDIRGKCVTCHATVFSGDVQSGISCEHCHGPASGYLSVHQTAGAYQAALGTGMIDVRKGPSEWAKQCLGCHVVTDQKLVAAGHYSGRDFNLQEKYRPVALHFKSQRSPAEVGAAAAALRPGAAPPPVAPVPTPAAAPPPAPPPAAPPAAGTTTPPPAPPPPVTPAPGAANPASAAPPPSAVAVAPDPAAAPPPPPPPPPPDPGVSAGSPSSALASLQGRLIAKLIELLQSGGTAPVRTPAAQRVVPYNGPDAALLQLQAEAITLALQVLGQPPAPVKKERP